MEKLELNSGIEVKLPQIEGFRGWDAADEYILSQEITDGVTLVIGDSYGALTCGIKGEVISFTQSVLSESAIKEAVLLNGSSVRVINNLTELPDRVDTIVLKLSKYIDLLEYYLQILGAKYKGAKFIAGGMVKYMPISMVRLVESYFSDVTTSLAKKKSRLIYGTAGDNAEKKTVFPKSYKTDLDLEVTSFPGVFSSEHLDIGTRFLIENMPKGRHGSILDLGCASGVLGLTAKKLNPDANVILTDESYLAVESAKESFKRNGLDGEFLAMDVLKGYSSDSVDIILCNPPFHQGNRVLTDIAIQMFKQSRKVLKRGGTLFVVANKHLGYHKKLRETFHNLKRVAENEKFIIFSVRKV